MNHPLPSYSFKSRVWISILKEQTNPKTTTDGNTSSSCLAATNKILQTARLHKYRDCHTNSNNNTTTKHQHLKHTTRLTQFGFFFFFLQLSALALLAFFLLHFSICHTFFDISNKSFFLDYTYIYHLSSTISSYK